MNDPVSIPLRIAVKMIVLAVAFYAVLYASVTLFDLWFGTYEIALLAGAFLLGCVGIVLREVRLARTAATEPTVTTQGSDQPDA